MRFHGEGMLQWDTWYVVDDRQQPSVVHAHYLQQLRAGSTRDPRDADSIGHATSTDLITWTEHPPALAPTDPGQPGDLTSWTGSTVLADGRGHLFFTIRSSATGGREQAIGLAVSDDLITWTRHPESPVLTPDPRWYADRDHPAAHGIVDCRDLMVVPHPDGGWFGVFATRLRSPDPESDPAATELPEGAVFGGASSPDLVHWTQTAPVFASPADRYSIVEMPDLFELDGRWYLTFLEDNAYGNRDVLDDPRHVTGTRYAVADRIEGPYVEPADNLLLASTGFNGISCRTVRLDGRLHVLYTSGERDGGRELAPTFGSLSLPKEVRLVDGVLRLCFAPMIMAHTRPVDPEGIIDLHSTHETWGRWTATTDGWSGEVRTAWARQSFGPEVGDLVASVRVRLEHGVAAGLMIKQQGSRGVVALLDVARGEVLLATVPRFQPIDVRRWPLRPDHEHLLRVVLTGPFVEVYVDEILVLQCLHHGPDTGHVGLFVDRGLAHFTDLRLHHLDA